MGKSFTYHVVGQTATIENRYSEVGAMSRLEMAQKRAHLARHGAPIAYWFAQTEVGRRILGGEWGPVRDASVPPVRTITCPVCEGHGCSCCRFSGITQRTQLTGYQTWQLNHIRQDLGLPALTP